ncbi:MAG TPA: SRPBCC family protein [Saprospiraceae bacterium]|nr:SRPBCC family protein [Saprospiraceae bacterium]
MNIENDSQIYSFRTIDAPIEKVYEAFANPSHLKNWWGPHGFTNTIHEYDLQPGGKWILTMHGPEVGNYENSSIFTEVLPMKLVSWTRLSQPLFDMEVGFEKIDETSTQISFRMIFDSPESCNKIKKFALPKNEENFDRLELELENMV